MQGAMARHDELVRNAIESAGGSVFTTAGDSFCAAFASSDSALEGAIAAELAVEAEDWGIVCPSACAWLCTAEPPTSETATTSVLH